ncbi:hypothetical protein ACFL4T_06545 [candidate division KSB1 bacterium]
MKCLDGKTLEALAKLICGDNGPYYRKGTEIADFFINAGLKIHKVGNLSRNYWAIEQLKIYNNEKNSLKYIIERIAYPKEYADKPEAFKEILEKLNQILTLEGYKIIMEGITPKIIEISASIPEFEHKKIHYVNIIPDFEKITNESTLSLILTERWKEIIKSLESSAHLSAIILMGSMLEGVLFAVVSQNQENANKVESAPKDRSGKVKPFNDWTLENLINVCVDCGWLKHDRKDFNHTLRDYRNLVHPLKQLKTGKYPDERTCKICWEVVIAAISDIEESVLKMKIK